MPKKTARKKEHSVITHKHNGSKWTRPKGGWGNSNSNEKGKNHRVKLALAILALIVLLILVGKIVGFVSSFNKPIYADSAVQRNYIWDQKSKLNLIVKSDEVYLVSFDPGEKKITALKLPSNLYLNAPDGLGTWQLSSLYELGQSNKERNGGTLLKQSVGNFLGMPVEGYIVFKDNLSTKSAQELITSIRDGFWNGFAMTNDLSTDFTPSELFALSSGIRGVRFDKVNSLDLEELNVLDKEILPDGTEVFVTDPVRLDSIAAKFADTAISQEKLPVAIFNSTSYPGLAQKAARIVANLGGNVIISANAYQTKGKTVMFVKDLEKKDLATPQVLGQIFTSDCSDNLKCDIIVCDLSNDTHNDQCEADPQIIESRAQINVVLGEDFKSRF